MMTEMTAQTDNQNDMSSDDHGEDANPPWVDRVKLRHGMDWLDLIKNEVERDTAIRGTVMRNSRPKPKNSILKKQSTEISVETGRQSKPKGR